MLENEYNVKIKDRWGESIFSRSIKTVDFTMSDDYKFVKNNSKIANQMRKKVSY